MLDNIISIVFINNHYNDIDLNSTLFAVLSVGIVHGTNDQYPIGNLTGKLNAMLDSVSEVNKLYHDCNLPLYGIDSVIGRSVTMISKVNNAIIQCSALHRQQVASSFTIKGVATFTGPDAIGNITLV